MRSVIRYVEQTEDFIAALSSRLQRSTRKLLQFIWQAIT
jgi:hypothetical protein